MSSSRPSGRAHLLGRLLAHRRAGESTLAWHAPGLAAPETITLSSAAFRDGGPIPERHAGRGVGENRSPALAWTGVPDGTRELVLVVEDRDVPLRRPIVHAVATGIDPAVPGLAEGDLNVGGPYGSGTGSFRRAGYAGPRPIPGHGPHTYVFQLYALDSAVVVAGSRPSAVLAEMRGHVLARGRLDGSYER
jgi:hypothetical protein